ncbi:fasciclin domain-containing protein [Haloferula sp.]|uniref:fasciclin domain-containing protein n=1 Tax=Haloferula sp. TaxID=2497595 RepID=UPI003C708E54
MKLTTTLFAAAALLLPISSHAETAEKPTQTVVEIAAGNDSFSTLVAAVKAAELAEALSGEGPFTIFAPTNDAFAKLPEGTVETLLKPENKEKLQGILKYHVVAGKVMAADVSAGEVEMLNGSKATITVKDGVVMIDKAKVVKTDIVGTNGVIHVIDSVILPAE